MKKESLFERRVIIVAGKGGTGKSTISAALGISAAKAKKKALLAETSDNNALGPLFRLEPLTQTPRELDPGLWGARINPRSVLEEYIQRYVTNTYISRRITRSNLFEHIAAATPGLKEIMTLSQIWRWEKKKNSDGSPFFDIIIVDSPATGHGLSLLRVPDTLLSMLRKGPIADQTEWVSEMLHDPEKTCIASVTIPEELPVNETLEFQRHIENDLGMKVSATIANMVYPEIFTPDEQSRIEKLYQKTGEKAETSVRQVLIAAHREITRRHLQMPYIRRLEKESECPVFRVPFFFTDKVDYDQIAEIANLFTKKPK